MLAARIQSANRMSAIVWTIPPWASGPAEVEDPIPAIRSGRARPMLAQPNHLGKDPVLTATIPVASATAAIGNQMIPMSAPRKSKSAPTTAGSLGVGHPDDQRVPDGVRRQGNPPGEEATTEGHRREPAGPSFGPAQVAAKAPEEPQREDHP